MYGRNLIATTPFRYRDGSPSEEVLLPWDLRIARGGDSEVRRTLKAFGTDAAHPLVHDWLVWSETPLDDPAGKHAAFEPMCRRMRVGIARMREFLWCVHLLGGETSLGSSGNQSQVYAAAPSSIQFSESHDLFWRLPTAQLVMRKWNVSLVLEASDLLCDLYSRFGRFGRRFIPLCSLSRTVLSTCPKTRLAQRLVTLIGNLEGLFISPDERRGSLRSSSVQANLATTWGIGGQPEAPEFAGMIDEILPIRNDAAHRGIIDDPLNHFSNAHYIAMATLEEALMRAIRWGIAYPESAKAVMPGVSR